MLAHRRGALLSYSSRYHCFIVHIIVIGWRMNYFSVLSSCGPFQSAEVPPFSVWAILVLSCPPNIFWRGPRQQWPYERENVSFESSGTAISVDCRGPPAHRKLRLRFWRSYFGIPKQINISGWPGFKPLTLSMTRRNEWHSRLLDHHGPV